MKKVAYKGDRNVETGKKIIDKLEILGGENEEQFMGFGDGYYYIGEDNVISIGYKLPDGYTLENVYEWKPRFGEEVFAWDEGLDVNDTFYYLGITTSGMHIVSLNFSKDEEYFETVYIYKNVSEFKKEMPEYTIEELKEKLGHEFKIKSNENL
jgi:hypothetical protein